MNIAPPTKFKNQSSAGIQSSLLVVRLFYFVRKRRKRFYDDLKILIVYRSAGIEQRNGSGTFGIQWMLLNCFSVKRTG